MQISQGRKKYLKLERGERHFEARFREAKGVLSETEGLFFIESLDWTCPSRHMRKKSKS